MMTRSPDSIGEYRDLWNDPGGLQDLIEGDRTRGGQGPLHRGIKAAMAIRDVHNSELPWLDHEGFSSIVHLIADLVLEVVRDDLTAERFVEKVARDLIHNYPLLPRMAGLLILDDVASDFTPKGEFPAHRPATLKALDQVADQLRKAIRENTEVVDGYSLEFLEDLGVWPEDRPEP